MLANLGLGFIAKLLGSPLGRWGISVILILTIVGLVLWRVFQAGVSKEKADAQIRTVENLRTKIEVDKELRAMPPDARRDALRKWVRDD